ncbi:protein HEADING DATE 3B-like isoform X2 [Lotus japonicus]|uniref:protein HEADING DATE 3B-like isoform X2 n=1 Tax=Lotus japonicus TaxID=34305 RepID=UPI00258B72F3|nr:protein HEADING DATE 3B-like isoform X2 [Lotus japonicus]
MKGAIGEGKEMISPMFPRLHVKDAEKGGPKAPPRNKMALYEQFSIPSSQGQFASSESGSPSLFPLLLRNCTLPPTSTQGSFLTSKNSLKTLGEDAFMTSGSACERNSSCGIIQNDKDDDKLARNNLNCSLKSLHSFRNKVNSSEAIDLNSAKYGKNQMEEPIVVRQIGLKPEEGPPHPLDGFGDMRDDESLNSLVKGRSSTSMKREHGSLKGEIRSISVDSLKTLQGRNVHTHEEHAAFEDNKDEEAYRDHDTLNKPSSECLFGRDISPDSVVGVIGEKEFWKARRTIINQQRIFLMQVFELHRLIKVQRLIAESPHLLLGDNSMLNKPQLKTSSSTKKLPSPSTVIKLESKSERTSTPEPAKNNAIGMFPLPSPINNIMSKSHSNQLSNYSHHLDINSPSCVYPPVPPVNQWLVPVMSPSEGLVYKAIIAPNAGFMAPPPTPPPPPIIASSLPQFLPPPSLMHHPSMSVEKMGQSNGPDQNHHSSGEVNSAMLYRSSSNLSTQTSRVMSRNILTHHSVEDKELQRSTASSPPSKKMKGDELPLFPVEPTSRLSAEQNTPVENLPRVIKALPHNPKSATESAARIFRSLQEERKYL